MAYQSAYAGSEIDQAVGEVQNRIWLPMHVDVTTNSWSDNSDSGHSATYQTLVTFPNVDKSKSLPPMVWFVSNDTGEQGNRYYCDFVSAPVGNQNSYSVTIYSNVKKAGTVYAFGLAPLTETTN